MSDPQLPDLDAEEVAQITEKLNSEVRRGSLVLAVLAQLQTEHYGYSLRKALADHGVQVEEGTLYPLVRRLENQGLLASEWREEARRKKRFYRLSPLGHVVFGELHQTWQTLNDGLSRILNEHTTATDGETDATS
ncbi:MAG: helix-turn-helix transcriptional regulator [Pseudomonadota bacterium]